jgi:hypothetical protein
VKTGFAVSAGKFSSRDHVVEYWILHDTDRNGSERLFGGVLVVYDKGEQNEPKFKWSDRGRQFYINEQRIVLGKEFILYVNDADGSPRKVILPLGIAQNTFSTSAPKTRNSLMTFWDKHIAPSL